MCDVKKRGGAGKALAAVALAALLGLPAAASAQLNPTYTNIQLDDWSTDIDAAGDIVVYKIREYWVGDINGDGRPYDDAVGWINARTGQRGYAPQVTWSEGRVVTDGQIIAFSTHEYFAGDQNGDGDNRDYLLAVYDISTGCIAYYDVGYYHYGKMAADNGQVAFMSHEYYVGDQNGDGDKNDLAIGVLDGKTGAVDYAGVVMVSDSTLGMSNGTVAFSSHEYYVGDLNGDGDRHDVLLGLYDVQTGAVRYEHVGSNWGGWDAPVAIDGDQVAFISTEYLVGDQNGDGDSRDQLLGVYDLARDTVTYKATPHYYEGDFDIWNGLVVFTWQSWPQRIGLWDIAADTVTDTGVSMRYSWCDPHYHPGTCGTSLALGDGTVGFMAHEYDLGQDYTGDGDKYDEILGYFQFPKGKLPPGWSKGKKTGWKGGSLPPGLKQPPAGFDQGEKTGWDRAPREAPHPTTITPPGQ